MIKGSAKRKYDLPDFEALLKDAKNGSEPALLKFLQCFEGLAVKLSRQSVCTDRLGEDALQIANLGILKAVRDWQEGDDIYRVAAFVTNKIRTELHTAIRRQQAVEAMESGSNQDASVKLDAQSYRAFQLSQQNRLRLWLVRECLPLLSHQQTKVIKGLLEGKTVLLIGRELHLDTRTISLHRSRAIKKLRLLLGVTA